MKKENSNFSEKKEIDKETKITTNETQNLKNKKQAKETKTTENNQSPEMKGEKKTVDQHSNITKKKEKTTPTDMTSEPMTVPKKETKEQNKNTIVELKKQTKDKLVKSTKLPEREWTGNPMLKPLIEKVTVNMSVGKSGTPLEQAVTIIKQLTNQKPSKRKAKKTIRDFGIRKGESIACLVTLRGENAKEFLKKAFYGVDNKISKHCFDRKGNFSFGIKEHINIPGTKYSPELGIHGMDVSVSLGRAGYRVKRRHRVRTKIGKKHLLTPEEAILFIKDEFDVEIL